MGAQIAAETKPAAISRPIGAACIEVEALSFALALWAGHEFIKRLEAGRERVGTKKTTCGYISQILRFI